MDDKLIEAVARRLNDKDLSTFDDLPALHKAVFNQQAQAALKSITDNGYAIVPVEPTEGQVTDALYSLGAGSPGTCRAIYNAMIEAAQ